MNETKQKSVMKGTHSYAVSAVCTVIFFILISLCFSIVNGKTLDPPNLPSSRHIFNNSSKHFASYTKLSQEKTENRMNLVTTSVCHSTNMIYEMIYEMQSSF